MRLHPTDALLVIDVQNDFMPGGALAIKDGDAIVPLINTLAKKFDHVILTQDWHPTQHISFATTHSNKQPFETIEAPYGPQSLWPDHVLQHSEGAAFHPALYIPHAELILRKGFRREVDSYSAFFENDHTTPTGLAAYLGERGLTRVFFAGLAYDYCVGYSALDARRLGLPVFIVRDACRAIDLNGSVARIDAEFAAAGVELIESAALLG